MAQTEDQKNRTKFRRLAAYLGIASKKRPIAMQARLALEVLEPRNLLSATSIPGATGGHGHDRATDRQLDHQRHAAEVQPTSQHDRIANNHQPRGRVGDHTASDRTLPSPNPQTSGPPPSSLQMALPPPPLGNPVPVFVNPPPQNGITEPAPSAPIAGVGGSSSLVEVGTSLTNLQTDLFAGALRTPVAEGESLVIAPNLDSTDRGTTVVNPNSASTPSDIAIREAFTLLTTADLVEFHTVIDEFAAARRLTFDLGSETSSATVFSAQSLIDDSSLEDGSSSGLREAAKPKPIRDGLIDIADLVDDLFAESSARNQSTESDLGEFTDASGDGPAATGAKKDGSRSSDILNEYRLNRTIDGTSVRTAAATSETSAPQALRAGMIELAHDGSLRAGVSSGQDAEVEMPALTDASFLKMDGPVARYQAFEMAPPVDAADDEAPRQAETPSRAQPLPETASYEASDRGPHASTPTTLASALFTVFFRRRTRRRAASTA